MQKGTTVYTIGHSNHPTDKFLALLRLHDVRTVADVRSRPRSRFPQFRQKALSDSLPKAGIEYIYLGQELGGYPSSHELYDRQDRVVYERLAAMRQFRRGVRQIAELAPTTRLALMCTEYKPADCHRHPLLAKVLLEQGIIVQHILRDGTLQDAAIMFAQESDQQLPLVEPPGEDLSWRSPKRVR